VSHIFISDIRAGERGNKPGFKKLAKDSSVNSCVHPNNPVRVVVAGGDGTVVWAMEEAHRHGVDMNKVAFGTIPYGTGNDFGRVLGWGTSNPTNVFDNEMEVFKNLVRSWLEATPKDFDLWEVTVEMSNRGRIRKWKGDESVVVKDETKKRRPVKKLVKLMSNYFSFGVESQIGIEFDKRRTSSQTLNKGVYIMEGFKKMFTPTSRIGDAVEHCYSNDRLVFTTDEEEGNVPILRGNPVSLIFLNINSFAGGCDIWSESKYIGLNNHEPLSFTDQLFSDRKLEVLSYQTLVGFGWEQFRRLHKFIPSFGQRIAQVEGMATMSFKNDVNVFAQVDGEFFHLERPKRITINHKVTTKVLERTIDEDLELDLF
jgi:diacylglycerol kinase (ATP)